LLNLNIDFVKYRSINATFTHRMKVAFLWVNYVEKNNKITNNVLTKFKFIVYLKYIYFFEII